MREFTYPVRVYYEDTDAGGVVYYANYLKFMERARTEWLRSLGFEQDVLRDQHQIIFAVRSLSVEYVQPARFNDALNVTVLLQECRGASITVLQTIQRQYDAASLCTGVVKIVSLQATSFKPVAIPHFIKDKLQEGELA